MSQAGSIGKGGGGGGGGPYVWVEVTSANNNVSLVKDHGYIPKGASQVIFVLPAAAGVGDMFRIAGYGNLWTLTQNVGQTVTEGIKTTMSGAGGSITATQVRDSVEIVCLTANTEFQILDSVGNLTFI